MSDKFEFIDTEYAAKIERNVPAPPIGRMCVLLEVSRSGYYEWQDRPTSATAQRRSALRLLIVKSFQDSQQTYGYRRVRADLIAWGVPASPELVRSLMRELDLEACQPRPWRHSLTAADGNPAAIQDLLGRDFTADAPGLKMVGDITYISTWEGWLFLATVIDCHTEEVIGWAMDDNYQTTLITAAIERATRNCHLLPGAVFHSDRGSNGEFNWSSQHLHDGGVFWWQGRSIQRRRWGRRETAGSGRQIVRCVRPCVHRGGLSRHARCSVRSGG